MRRHRHVKALRSLLGARIESMPDAPARELLRSHLRTVEQEPESRRRDELAEELGIAALVESCRDEHLASLDADDGLLTLGIGWHEVVAGDPPAPPPLLSPSRFPSCPRCAAAMVERRLRGSRRRRGKRRDLRATSPSSRIYRCLGCGLVLRS